MQTDPNILIAFVAGLLSFLSPCVLPLIPSYLSFVGGVSLQDLREKRQAGRQVFIRTLFFVLGFTLVFVALGVLFSGSGFLFSGIGRWINIVAGSIVVFLGVNVLFDFLSFLNLEKRMHVGNRPTTYLGATVVGMAFGAGWSPCIGPILAGILFLAGSSGQVIEGTIYLLAYSIGLGLPFVAASLAFSKVASYLNRIRRHLGAIRVASGVFLIFVGILIAFGRFQQINAAIISAGVRLQYWSDGNPSAARSVFTASAALLAVLQPTIRALRKRPILTPLGTTISALFALVAVLTATGRVDLAAVVASWLTYQGI